MPWINIHQSRRCCGVEHNDHRTILQLELISQPWPENHPVHQPLIGAILNGAFKTDADRLSEERIRTADVKKTSKGVGDQEMVIQHSRGGR